MKLRVPFSNLQLAKIATAGAIFVGGNAIYMMYLVKKRFYTSEYFVNATKKVLAHEALVKYLGEPISFGHPDLGNRRKNFSTDTEAQYEVPIRGSNTKGIMLFSASRLLAGSSDDPPSESTTTAPWIVTNLEVIVDDRPNEKVVIVKNSRS